MAKPIVTAGNTSVARGLSRAASALFSVTDADGDAVTAYEFWDSGTDASSGYFSINGNAQGANGLIAVNAALLNQVQFIGGAVAGAETVWVRVVAGGEFSDWVPWTMTTTGSAPVASASNRGAHINQSVLASTLFGVSDADGDAITRYEFWDSGPATTSGHFTVDGLQQDAGAGFVISAAELANTRYVGGTANGAETLWVRAADAGGFGAWAGWQMNTGNVAPTVTGSNRNLGKGQSVGAGTLFTVSDAEADAIAAYELWDAGTGAGSGHFSVNGTAKPAGSGFAVDPAEFNLTTFVAGSLGGSEILWARAYDGFDWSPWASLTLTTTNQRPVVSVSNAAIGRNSAQAVSGLYSVNDADGDAIAQVQFWDSGLAPESAYLRINGVRQGAGVGITVAAADLAATQVVGGSGPGAETVWVRAHDGTDWGEWVSFTLTTTGSAPVVSAANAGVHTAQSVLASSLFTVNDADGDVPGSYELWDSNAAASSGHFTVSGVQKPAGAGFVISAAELANTRYVGGTANGAETLWVRAADAGGFGAWAGWQMNTGNVAPTVTGSNRNLGKGQSVGAGTLFSVSDAEADAIVSYELWDGGTGAGSGHFSVNGTVKPAGSGFLVNANEFTLTTFVAGSLGGSEILWARAYDGFDWSPWASLTLTTTNQRPVVSVSNAAIGRNSAQAVSGLYSVNDADGDAIAQVQFWDSGLAPESAYLRINGVRQGAGVGITVAAADLAATQVVGGSGPGAETVWVRAHDGTDWGEWVSFTLTTTGSAPVVSAANAGVHTAQSVLASSLFTVNDADGDVPGSYELWDSNAAASSGHFTVSGVQKPAGAGFVISAAELANTRYVGGTANGAETLWVRAADAGGFGAWAGWQMNTGNVAPTVTGSNRNLGKGQSVGAGTLFSVSDAEADAIVSYELWDGGTGAGSGHFSVNGTVKPAGSGFLVNANEFTLTTFVAGSLGGSEILWARAYDGFDWSPWASLTLTTTNQLPTVSASNADVAWGQSVSLGPLLTTGDADGDAMVQYDFRDGESAGSSGYITVAGVAQTAGQPVVVDATQLATVHFVGGTAAGTETLWIRVFDGSDWSAWAQWSMTTTGNAPLVSASDATVGTSQSVPASTLFSATDADGNAITQYEFYDTGTATTGGHFAIDGVAQPAQTSIIVTAADLSKVTYVGGENPGTEQVRLRANDGSGWGPQQSWNVTTAIRFQEVIGTPSGDSFQTGALGTDKIYLGLAGNDSFQSQSGDEVLLMGGTGSDSYWIGNLNNVFITVFENGNSAGDFIQPALNANSDTAVLATIDGRHLLLGDTSTDRLVLVIDWQQPANQIETWFIGGGPFANGGMFPYAEFAQVVIDSEVPNFAFDELVAAEPVALAGFSSAVFSEMLSFYAQRENKIVNNQVPVVTATSTSLRSGTSIPLSNLFSTSDPNGDPIVRYEIHMGFDSPVAGYITINGVEHREQVVQIEAGDLANGQYVSIPVGERSHGLTIKAYDGIAWSTGTLTVANATINHAPEIVFFDGNMEVRLGRSIAAAAWFRAIDRDGDTVTQYELSESNGTPGVANGHFELGGVAQTSPFIVTAAQLDALVYVVPSGSDFFELITVSAFDGETWSDEPSSFLYASVSGNRAPELLLKNELQTIVPGQSVAVSSWFTVVDPDGDPIAQYTFNDLTGGRGEFRLNGVPQAASFTIAASDLANVVFVADSAVPGSQPWSVDSVSMTASDGTATSSPGTGVGVYTTSNRPPTVTAADAALGLGQSTAASSLFAASDPDGDAFFGYGFRDLGSGSGSGYFTINGVRPSGQTFGVDANNLGQVRYHSSSQAGVEMVAVRASSDLNPNITAGGNWAYFSIRSGAAQPDGAGNSQGSARVVSVGEHTTQAFDDVVADNDLLDYYRLNVAAPGNLVLALTQLGGNADLQLLDNGGSVLASSLNPDNWSERISQTVATGTYYARIIPVAGHDTSYHFAVSLV